MATRCVELERHDKLSKTEAEPDILILRSMHQSRREEDFRIPTTPQNLTNALVRGGAAPREPKPEKNDDSKEEAGWKPDREGAIPPDRSS